MLKKVDGGEREWKRNTSIANASAWVYLLGVRLGVYVSLCFVVLCVYASVCYLPLRKWTVEIVDGIGHCPGKSREVDRALEPFGHHF